MTPPPAKDKFVFELCFGAMSIKVPQFREAMNRRDESTVRSLARELRNTVELLGLPRLFQLSQDIEYQPIGADAQVWHGQCTRFCDLLENIHWSLKQKLQKN
jgi:hypothetical protein